MGTLARQINRLERLSGKYQVEPVSVRSGAERHGDATMVLRDGCAGARGVITLLPSDERDTYGETGGDNLRGVSDSPSMRQETV